MSLIFAMLIGATVLPVHQPEPPEELEVQGKELGQQGVASKEESQKFEQVTGQWFTIRAGDKSVEVVNSVLARYAKPTQTLVPAGSDPAIYVAEACGNQLEPEIFGTRDLDNGGGTVVTHQTCARFEVDQEFIVNEGFLYGEIALRAGLEVYDYRSFCVVTEAGCEHRNEKKLQIGDRVRVPVAPSWTRFLIEDEFSRRPAHLRGIISDQLDCAKGAAEDCLLANQVALLTDKRVVSETPLDPQVNEGSNGTLDAPWNVSAQVSDDGNEGLPKSDKTSFFSATGYIQSSSGTPLPAGRDIAGLVDDELAAQWTDVSPSNEQDNLTAAIPLGAMAFAQGNGQSPRLPDSGRVASDQWPYDPEMVARLLDRSSDKMRQVTVGVADSGLGSRDGSPFKADNVFIANSRELEGSEDHDDDRNNYLDDKYGAGVFRLNSEPPYAGLKGDGDLSLCSLYRGNWDPDALEKASHGSIAISLASGDTLRSLVERSPPIPKAMPFRITDVAKCEPPLETPDPPSTSVNEALYYFGDPNWPVGTSPNVINLSLSINVDPGEERTFEGALGRVLIGENKLLTVAAGNAISPRNLDIEPSFPASFANPREGPTLNLWQKIIAVGAAERDLTRARYSNFGPNTVRFFASGSPLGAKGIDGLPADNLRSATSYASPRVALAIAILQSKGVSNIEVVKRYLNAASWPLHDKEGSWGFNGPKVIDLTRIAAIDHDVVTVIEEEGGAQVFRSYVGRLVPSANGKIKIARTRAIERANYLELIAKHQSGSTQFLLRERRVNKYFDEPSSGTLFPPTESDDEIAIKIELLETGETREFLVKNLYQILFSRQAG